MADQIIVLDKGEIVEKGTYDELLNTGVVLKSAVIPLPHHHIKKETVPSPQNHISNILSSGLRANVIICYTLGANRVYLTLLNNSILSGLFSMRCKDAILLLVKPAFGLLNKIQAFVNQLTPNQVALLPDYPAIFATENQRQL